MFENTKKLRRLLKLQEEDEAQMRSKGFTPETLKVEIKWLQDRIAKDINAGGWILMFLIVIPLALMEIGFSIRASVFICYLGAGTIFMFILPKITGRYY